MGDALVVIQRFLQHRQVVGAAFVLLAVLARDAGAARRLATTEAASVLAAAKERWPDALSGAVRCSTQPLSPLLLDGLPLSGEALQRASGGATAGVASLDLSATGQKQSRSTQQRVGSAVRRGSQARTGRALGRCRAARAAAALE